MKTKALKAPKTFQPVQLEITFESQEELDAFAGLFNVGPIYDAMKKIRN